MDEGVSSTRLSILDVDLTLLLSSGDRVIMHRGQWFDIEPDAAGFLYLVLAGELRVSTFSSTGREIVLQHAGPGSMVGLDNRRAAGEGWVRTVVATAEETAVCRLSLAAFRQFLRDHPEAALAVLDDTAHHLAAAFDLIRDLALYDVKTRLAHLLARLAARDAAATVWATHTELAAMIGTSQTRVTRLLAELRALRLIDYQRHRRGITVLDVDQLRSDQLEAAEPG